MFTIIGERINMTRERIRERVGARDGGFVAGEARRQAEAGATHIDVNAGGEPAREVDDMTWLAGVVKDAIDLPLVFDSTNPEALRAGLEVCNRPGTIINSISGERSRLDGVLPLVSEFNTGVVCLTMDEGGMPTDLDDRVRITRDLMGALGEQGVGSDRAYVDHLVVAAASPPPCQTPFILQAIAALKREFPQAHACLGLTNISHGLPARNNLNRAFLAMVVAAGADAAIMDPCEPGMMTTLLSARAVLGLDEYCMAYIQAHRAGNL